MNNNAPNKIRIGNRIKSTHKSRFSKNEMLRIQSTGRISGGTGSFYDWYPKWISDLMDELAIPKPYPKENPVERFQSELARKHNAIEKACRMFAEAKQAERRKQRRPRRKPGGDNNGILRKG